VDRFSINPAAPVPLPSSVQPPPLRAGPNESTRLFQTPEETLPPVPDLSKQVASLPTLVPVAGPAEATRLFETPQGAVPPPSDLSRRLAALPNLGADVNELRTTPTLAPLPVSPASGASPWNSVPASASSPGGGSAFPETSLLPIPASVQPPTGVPPAQEAAKPVDRAFILWVTLGLSALLGVIAYGLLHRPTPAEEEQEKTQKVFQQIYYGR
jgi:hypothetical protein